MIPLQVVSRKYEGLPSREGSPRGAWGASTVHYWSPMSDPPTTVSWAPPSSPDPQPLTLQAVFRRPECLFVAVQRPRTKRRHPGSLRRRIRLRAEGPPRRDSSRRQRACIVRRSEFVHTSTSSLYDRHPSRVRDHRNPLRLSCQFDLSLTRYYGPADLGQRLHRGCYTAGVARTLGTYPIRIFDDFRNVAQLYQYSRAILSALELDLFTAIGARTWPIAALARRLRADQRGVDILCRNLAALGLLVKRGSAYRNTLLTRTELNRRSPAYRGAYLARSPQGGARDRSDASRQGPAELRDAGFHERSSARPLRRGLAVEHHPHLRAGAERGPLPQDPQGPHPGRAPVHPRRIPHRPARAIPHRHDGVRPDHAALHRHRQHLCVAGRDALAAQGRLCEGTAVDRDGKTERRRERADRRKALTDLAGHHSFLFKLRSPSASAANSSMLNVSARRRGSMPACSNAAAVGAPSKPSSRSEFGRALRRCANPARTTRKKNASSATETRGFGNGVSTTTADPTCGFGRKHVGGTLNACRTSQ